MTDVWEVANLDEVGTPNAIHHVEADVDAHVRPRVSQLHDWNL